jgi:hypothetical protein
MPRDSMTPVLDYAGLPLTARVVIGAVTKHVGKGKATGKKLKGAAV